jgi:hypothetical protein
MTIGAWEAQVATSELRRRALEPRGRIELFAVATFVEGVCSGSIGWRAERLATWIDQHLVAQGLLPRPTHVSEPPVGRVVVEPRLSSSAHATAIRQLVLAARARTVAALRGLQARPADDRFLAGAIFAGQVRRETVGEQSRWRVHLTPECSLSTILKSLLAVDVLSHREQYDTTLRVCDICGRLWFEQDPILPLVMECAEHQVGTPTTVPPKSLPPVARVGGLARR